MKKAYVIGMILGCCLSATTAVADNMPLLKSLGATSRFTTEMVSGKTMVSSGYQDGTITFNTDGTLTCKGYPSFVTCKTWKIDSDGSIVRTFNDTRNNVTTEVTATWQLLKINEKSFDVSQTSSNSVGATAITVTCK